MKKIWYMLPALAGVVLSAAASGEEQRTPIFKSSAKLGLWVIERHSNISMFLAPPKNPVDAAARSEEMLKMPGMQRKICVTEELRQKLLDRLTGADGCVMQAPKIAENTETIDGVCYGKTYHVSVTFGTPERVMTAAHMVVEDPATPDGGGITDVRYDTPEHITITTTLNRQEGGVHMIDVWDVRRLGPDCGDVKTGEVNPLKGKPETTH